MAKPRNSQLWICSANFEQGLHSPHLCSSYFFLLSKRSSFNRLSALSLCWITPNSSDSRLSSWSKRSRTLPWRATLFSVSTAASPPADLKAICGRDSTAASSSACLSFCCKLDLNVRRGEEGRGGKERNFLLGLVWWRTKCRCLWKNRIFCIFH